jgi:hypothetical protein
MTSAIATQSRPERARADQSANADRERAKRYAAQLRALGIKPA